MVVVVMNVATVSMSMTQGLMPVMMAVGFFYWITMVMVMVLVIMSVDVFVIKAAVEVAVPVGEEAREVGNTPLGDRDY